jgi:phospholipid/cholesterol/gamma-HCH transport system substrate-binding protein
MKISNETKVGALTVIAVTLLVLGFNFLKGKNVFSRGNVIYAQYPDAKGLMVSNPVYINGFQVGTVSAIENADKTLKAINVTIKLKDEYLIPSNSIASIIKDPLGTPSIEIALGNSTTYLKSGDKITPSETSGILGEVANRLLPVADQLKITTHTLDSVLRNLNSIFDENTKGNVRDVVGNLNKTTANLSLTSALLQKLLAEQSNAIGQTVGNLNSFTKNLADNNGKLSNAMGNLEKTTENLSNADIDGSVEKLKTSIDKLNGLLDKVDSKDGSLGLLMNDKSLYNNLVNTLRSANILVDDLRAHPKRYVSISVFGKKDKGEMLTAPLDTSNFIK